jgi:hypothetical protein
MGDQDEDANPASAAGGGSKQFERGTVHRGSGYNPGHSKGTLRSNPLYADRDPLLSRAQNGNQLATATRGRGGVSRKCRKPMLAVFVAALLGGVAAVV